MPEVRCRFDHVGGAGSTAVELAGLVREVEARDVPDVVAVLDEVESAARQGWHAAGFVAYEAAPAFDPALVVRSAPVGDTSGGAEPAGTTVPDATPIATSGSILPTGEGAALPLAWFGIFEEARPAPPLTPGGLGAPRGSWPGDPAGGWSAEMGPADHGAAVEAIRGAIVGGRTYLVNLTTRFRHPWTADDDPFALYQHLVAGHAGGHHAYLETAGWAVACGSPELFFELVGGALTTRPMKGTAPRGRWTGEDLAHAEGLRSSDKERAENVMVVDLLRNDLGRIAVPGTVAVPELWQVERHPTVWQLTSTVTAVPRGDVGLADVFAAVFPCGSVTGAPKVSAMGVIADLERSPRGPYCGAVGWVGPDGGGSPGPTGPVAARFAVGIRTAVVDKAAHLVEYGSGGGITWDSSAAAEWDEVVVKTRALAGPGPLAGVGLVETMRFEPAGAGGVAPPGGRVRNLDAHLARLAGSAAFLGLPPPTDAAVRIAEAVAGLTVPARVRLVLRPDGGLEVGADALAPGELEDVTVTLCIDPVPVRSGDPGLFHKTTDRRRYEDRARRHDHAGDVVLVNERGEVTETTRANLAVLVGGEWWTPPLCCGLLPGVERGRLLDAGKLVERVVTVEQLVEAEGVATFSSLRGWRRARVLHGCPGPDAG